MARSIARAVRGASGIVTTLPPLRVIVRVRCPRSGPMCSISAPVASDTRSPFSASSEISACSSGLAQQFALLNPRLCRRLILVATATGPQTMVPPNPLPPVKNLILRRWGDLWGGSAKTDPDALARALRKARISPLSIGFLYQHTAALGFTTLPLLPLIRQRTLVLTGDDDPIIPVANGRILAAGIPHATLHVYHGGHVELATRPSLLTPLITSFLAAPPHDARRAEQTQTDRHPEDQGPRRAADGTAVARAAQATAEADALAEALRAARAAQQAAETAAAALRDAREQAAAAQAAALR